MAPFLNLSCVQRPRLSFRVVADVGLDPVAKLQQWGYQIMPASSFTLFKWRLRHWFPLGSKILWKSPLDPEAVLLSTPTASCGHSPPASHISVTALWTTFSLVKKKQLGMPAERHSVCRKAWRSYKGMYLTDHSPPPPNIHTQDPKSEKTFDRAGDSVVEISL